MSAPNVDLRVHPVLAAGTPERAMRVAAAGAALLAFAAVLALAAEDGWAHLMHAWLVGSSLVVSIGLGALFFVLIQHLTAAGWSVVVRRIAERLTDLIPVGAIMFVPIVVQTLSGDGALYPWADAEAAAADPITSKKAVYLNGGFFALRMALYFGCWIFIARTFTRLSLEQDADGDPARTVRMRKLSAPAMLAFAITVTFFAFDALMSLDPHWFSTIFGVYFFSGAVVGAVAVITLVTLALERGPLAGVVTTEHFHDLGKLLFGFVFFWGYIAFSQYLLIWYANIPEETVWYIHRDQGIWRWVSLTLVFGHFLIPFAALLSRGAKRDRKQLAFWAGFLVLMHVVDLFWLVNPSLGHGAGLHLIDLVTWAALATLATAVFLHRSSRGSLVPVRDPRLGESLNFTNV